MVNSIFFDALLPALHVFVCSVLMFVVMLQQGKGGGMGAALGGGGAAQVFGGRGAGNILTRATAIAAMTFMLTSVSLAWHSSQGDRALKARSAAEEDKRATKAKAKEDKAKAAPAPSAASAGSAAPAGAGGAVPPVDPGAAMTPVVPPAPAPAP